MGRPAALVSLSPLLYILQKVMVLCEVIDKGKQNLESFNSIRVLILLYESFIFTYVRHD